MNEEAKRIMEKYPTRIPIIVEKHKYCSLPWTSAVILGNGDVMACCVPGTVMGNLNIQPLEELWNGKNYKEFRKKVNSGNPPSVCNSCPYLRYENNESGILFNKVDSSWE